MRKGGRAREKGRHKVPTKSGQHSRNIPQEDLSIAQDSDGDDIEIVFGDLQLVTPRKSPKKEGKQTSKGTNGTQPRGRPRKTALQADFEEPSTKTGLQENGQRSEDQVEVSGTPRKSPKSSAQSTPGKSKETDPRERARKTPLKLDAVKGSSSARSGHKNATTADGQGARKTRAARALKASFLAGTPRKGAASGSRRQPDCSPNKDQDTDLSPPKAVATAPHPPPSAELANPLTKPELESGLGECLPALWAKLVSPTGGDASQVPIQQSLREVQQDLENMMQTTAETPGEANSMLLLGRAGVGKTLVAERAAAATLKKYNIAGGPPRVAFVRLHGRIHADEQIAFQAIARQICKSFTLPFVKEASHYENLNFLREMLKDLQRCRKVVCFILDDFDIFAQRPKQALLYNLLDVLQASNMQAAVLGISRRYNVAEMLEKRVKSRFSYSIKLALPSTAASFDGDIEGPPALLRALLTLQESEEVTAASARFVTHFNASLQAAVSDLKVQASLRKCWDAGHGSPAHASRIAQFLLGEITRAGALPTAKHLLSAIGAASAGPKSLVATVAHLSVLESFMLVALQRLECKGREFLNFEMAYDEYSGLRRGGSYRGVDDTAPRQAAMIAFERLLSASLAAYKDKRNAIKSRLPEFAAVELLVTQEEIEAGLRLSSKLPLVLIEWLKKAAITS